MNSMLSAVARIAIVAALLASGAEHLSAGQAQAGVQETWGEDTKVVAYDRFYIAGQPDEAALERAREHGVTMVINLRGESESDWDEASVAGSLGLDFHRYPVNGAAPELEAEPFEQANAAVLQAPEGKILVHCASGNRASAWLAVYLVQHAGVSREQALAVARETGLKGSLADRVEAYLEGLAESQAIAN